MRQIRRDNPSNQNRQAAHPSRKRRKTGCLPLFWLFAGLGLGLGLALMAVFNGWLPSLGFGERKPSSDDGSLAKLYTPTVRYWTADIHRWADEWGLDADLVATLIQIESCGDFKAQSAAGAQGLFQVMPFHFAPGDNPLDPQDNAERGMAYLKNAWDASGGDVRLTLAGYNGGIDMAGQPEANWPQETGQYVYWGNGIYQDVKSGSTHSDTLNAWLTSGGIKLCIQAGLDLGVQP
jgi:hypothetical protein